MVTKGERGGGGINILSTLGEYLCVFSPPFLSSFLPPSLPPSLPSFLSLLQRVLARTCDTHLSRYYLRGSQNHKLYTFLVGEIIPYCFPKMMEQFLLQLILNNTAKLFPFPYILTNILLHLGFTNMIGLKGYLIVVFI